MTIDKGGLAPCPFCGAQAEVLGHYGIAPYFVRCHGDISCMATGPTAAYREHAIAAWNRRALPDTGDELVAKLRAFADDCRRLDLTEGRPALALEAAAAIASLTARTEAAETSLASAREALEWYADRVGGVNGWSIEGAKTRAELAEDNGRRAYAALKEVR